MSNHPLKILVYGATGSQGNPVLRKLLQKGHQVRALVRDPNKVDTLLFKDVETVVGTLEDKENLKHANAGIDRVFLVLPLECRFDVAIAQGYNAIDAACNAGVKLLVFNISTFIPQRVADVAAFEIKRDLEQYLQRSNVPNIVL